MSNKHWTEFYYTNHCARTLADVLVDRTARRSMTVEAAQILLIGFESSHIRAVFRKMDEFGFGRFIVGRSGHSSRFSFEISSVDAGRALRGEIGCILRNNEDRIPEERNMRAYVFPLRSNLKVQFFLPSDVTAEELRILSENIKTSINK
jgi:hypothetical protein